MKWRHTLKQNALTKQIMRYILSVEKLVIYGKTALMNLRNASIATGPIEP